MIQIAEQKLDVIIAGAGLYEILPVDLFDGGLRPTGLMGGPAVSFSE